MNVDNGLTLQEPGCCIHVVDGLTLQEPGSMYKC